VSADSVVHIRSRDNALLKDLRRLAQGSSEYRRQHRVWLEGDHLCRAALDRGLRPALAVFSEGIWHEAKAEYAHAAIKTIVISDSLMAAISALESPVAMGFVIDLPPAPQLAPRAPSVVLDRIQDAGNAGAILRSAAAFGFHQVIALKGTAALWSPKVLRAGMGAHFALQLFDAAEPALLDALALPLVATSSHGGPVLGEQPLPAPCAWVFGHEGQGIGAELMQRCDLRVRIAQPGGEESLNVAAAAAICLHASAAAAAAQRPPGSAPL
jgi:TrmH family RNA methyltransferase